MSESELSPLLSLLRQFDKNSEKWAYVLQADLYNKLSQSKVIQEAALRSGSASVCTDMCGGGFDYYGKGLLTQEVSGPFWVLTVTAKLRMMLIC